MTGAGGLLGGRLAALLYERGFEVVAAHRHAAPPPGPLPVACDLSGPAAVGRLLDAHTVDAVLHAAVLSRAEECEARPAEAERLNARLPGWVAEACAARGRRLVALSTDLVFAGDRAFVSEDAPTGPLSAYGRTKLEGERAVLRAHPAAAVARVALVLGRGHGPRATSSETILRALAAGRPLRLFTDEYRTPVDPESLASALAALLEGAQPGLFHLGGRERLSRYDLGLRVARAFGLDPRVLEPALQRDHAGPERRAPDVSLDSARARRELGYSPRPLDEAIADTRR